MFTRERLFPPTLTGDWQVDGPRVLAALNEYLFTLNKKGALSINEAEITASQGIKFPATQVSSTDANTLDDYEEGTTSPTPTSGTGTLTSVTGTVRYTKIGNRVFYNVTVVITTNGTGATDIRVTMPFTAADTTPSHGTDNGITFDMTGHVTGSTLIFKKYDGTYPGADGVTLRMAGNFRV